MPNSCPSSTCVKPRLSLNSFILFFGFKALTPFLLHHYYISNRNKCQ
nr:MAG TPA: hypothetical protein [Caudoviricetes sp.]